MEKEKAVYTHKQMCDMISVTRTWTLNSPSGGLPFLPMQWVDYVSQEANVSANIKTMPPYKKPHWLVNLLMKLKIL
jgi:hypothetical protein